jgi:hypothetical protein
VKIVYELMNDSVLGPFLASVAAPHEDFMEDDSHDARRSRHRSHKESSPHSDDSHRSPKTGFLPLLNIPWTSEPKSSASSSSDPAERGGLTDDSANSPASIGNEPMTPPTTPPLSEWGFSTSPGGIQKAISSHNNGWKKMGAKLGLNRMGRNKRGHSSSATSAPLDVNLPVRDSDHIRRKTNPL